MCPPDEVQCAGGQRSEYSQHPGLSQGGHAGARLSVMAPKRKAASASASKDPPDAPSSKRKKTEAPMKESVPVSKWDCILLP